MGFTCIFLHFSKSVFGALAKCCMGFTCNLFTFAICFWLVGQVLNGIYLQFIQFSKSVFGALAKCCMGFTCNLFNFPNLFRALWPSAAWDLLAIYSIFQICFWRFGQVLHGIYFQFIYFSKSVFGALAKCCMGFTCNLFNFPNLFLALWPSAAWDLLAIYSLFQICFWRFGQVLHGIYLQFIHCSKSVFGALAKCCMGFTCKLFNFPNLFQALWPSAAWDLLAIYSISKSVSGALAKCCMGFTCNLFNFPNLFRALWPSAAWDLLAIYPIFQICFWRFGQVLHGIYLQFIQFSKSVFGALAKCCMGFTCNLFNFPNLFLALWPSAAWDLLAIYSLFQICFWLLAKCCMGFTRIFCTFPNLFLALWPSAAWDLLAIYSIFLNLFLALWPSAAWDLLAMYPIFQICFWRFGQVLHGIYLQFFQFSKSVFVAFQICFGRFGQVLHGIYLQFIQFSKSVSGALAKCCMGFTCNSLNFPNLFLALWPSAAWDLLAIYLIFQICFGRFGQVLHGIYLQFIQLSKSVFGALAKCCMGFTCNLFTFPNLFLALWPSAAWDLLATYSIFQICFWRFGQVLHGIYLQFIQFSKSVSGALAKCCMGFICNSFNFPNLFLALCQVLHGIYVQFIQLSKSVFGASAKCCMGFTCNLFTFPNLFLGALAKCCMGFTCNLLTFPNLFLALWPSAARDLLAIYSIFQICFGRFGQVLHGIYLQVIQFSKSFLGAFAMCCMGFTCNLFNFQICFGRFGQVLHGIYLQFIQFSKSGSGALAKCCMGFTCNLFNFPNLFLALWPSAEWDLLATYSIFQICFWPSAAWDLLAIHSLFQICFWRFCQVLHGIYLQFIQFSKSVSGALAKCCMGFTCNLFNFPNLFLALWPSAAWYLLAIYSLFQICFWRFGQVLHGIYLQFIHFSKSVFGALAKCCMGFTCNLFTFPNLFLALWPSAAWDLLAIYPIFRICFWRFGQVLHGIYLQCIQFPNLFLALWPSAAWDLLSIYSLFQICFWRFGQVLWDLLAVDSLFQICFWRFGQVLHGIYFQFIHFSKCVFGALAKCCMGFTCS